MWKRAKKNFSFFENQWGDFKTYSKITLVKTEKLLQE